MFEKCWFYLLQRKPFKNDEKWKNFDENFCLEAFGHEGKQQNKKAKVNFKIHDVIYWETNKIQNTHCAVSQEVKTIRQRSWVS